MFLTAEGGLSNVRDLTRPISENKTKNKNLGGKHRRKYFFRCSITSLWERKKEDGKCKVLKFAFFHEVFPNYFAKIASSGRR